MEMRLLDCSAAPRATAACHGTAPARHQFTVFGWCLTWQREPDYAYRQLERRMRPATPSPLAFAILVAALLVVTVAAVRWLEMPSSGDDSGTMTAGVQLADVRMRRR